MIWIPVHTLLLSRTVYANGKGHFSSCGFDPHLTVIDCGILHISQSLCCTGFRTIFTLVDHEY